MEIGPKSRCRTLLGMALCCAAAATIAARADDWAGNGEFDFDTLGWVQSDNGLNPDWQTIDHDECGNASGSARLENDQPNAGQSVFAHTCALGIVGGAPHSLDGFLRFASGQAPSGTASMAITFHDSALDCSGNILGSEFTSDVASTNTDAWVQRARRNLVAPAGAQSARIYLYVTKNEAGGTLRAHFDGIHLVNFNGYLFGDGFETESTCRWSLEVVP